MVDEIALPAFGLVGHAFLVDLLIFRSERRLLRRSERLVGVELNALAAEARVDRVPLAFPVGVFRLAGGLRAADRHHQCGQGDHSGRASMQHDHSPCMDGRFA